MRKIGRGVFLGERKGGSSSTKDIRATVQPCKQPDQPKGRREHRTMRMLPLFPTTHAHTTRVVCQIFFFLSSFPSLSSPSPPLFLRPSLFFTPFVFPAPFTPPPPPTFISRLVRIGTPDHAARLQTSITVIIGWHRSNPFSLHTLFFSPFFLHLSLLHSLFVLCLLLSALTNKHKQPKKRLSTDE